MSLITLDLNKEVTALSGQPIEGSNIGAIIGNFFGQVSTEDFEKFVDWGKLLVSRQPIQVDNSDFNKIKVLIDSSGLANMVKVQAMEVIRAAEKT